MKKIRAHLTYANVAATLALFLALTGGIAVAANELAKNSVGTNQLKNGAVSTTKIKAGAVTGAKVNLSSLGTVPSASHADSATRADSAASATSAGNAAALQGQPASAFVKGGGELLSARVVVANGQTGVPFLTVPGLGPVTVSCLAGAVNNSKGDWIFVNQTGSVINQTLQYGPGNDGTTIPPGENISWGGDEGVGAWTVQLSTDTSPSTIATLNLSFNSRGGTKTSDCTFYGQILITPPR